MKDPFASKPITLATGIAGVVAVGYLDYVTGAEVRIFPLYFVPIALVAWRLSRTASLMLSLLSASTWVLANWHGGTIYSSSVIWYVNFTTQFVAFGTVGELVSVVRARLLAEEALGRRDPLTSLANRRAFYERAELTLAAAHRAERPITVAYLDLDNFKMVNDAHGHKEGDRALKVTAEVMTSRVRTSDLVARLAGDEFAILLSDTAEHGARVSLERVREAIVEAMRRNEWPVTVSIGAVSYLRAPATLEQAVSDADALMYRAKGAGKNRIHIEQIDLKPAVHSRRPPRS